MKDIKSLYEAAKSSGKQEDIFAYTDAVTELLESKPIDFLSNLEYIITSDIGLSRLNEFVERYGLSIAVYDDIVACLESCVEKCKKQKKDSSLYEEYLEKYGMFKDQYSNCFTMFESESEDLDINKYVNTYYGFNENGVQNSKLLVGMIKEFGEAAIADALVTANRVGGNALDQTFKYLESYESENMSKSTLNQWITECSIDVVDNIKDESSLRIIAENSLSNIVDDIDERHQEVYRESVIMGNPEPEIGYTTEEVDIIRDLISFKEYQVTATNDPKMSYEYQKQVYDLYEKFGNLFIEEELGEDVADTVAPMLPQSTGVGPAHDFEEDMSLMNTTNKKTGNAPGYISQNHNLSWGEDDSGSNEIQKTLADYERDSAKGNGEDETTPSYDNDSDNSSDEDQKDTNTGNANPRTTFQYFYYGDIGDKYQDSNNHYSHSHNKSDSHNIDNSVDNSRKNDDHSTGKHINSHNDNTDDHHEESAISSILNLNIPGGNTSFF